MSENEDDYIIEEDGKIEKTIKKSSTTLTGVPIKKKREYIMTEARKLALERANKKRLENASLRKIEKEKLKTEEDMLLQNKILEKAEKIEKNRNKIVKKIDNIPNIVVSPHEIPIVKPSKNVIPKSKKITSNSGERRKPTNVIYESSSEVSEVSDNEYSDEDEIYIIKKGKKNINKDKCVKGEVSTTAKLQNNNCESTTVENVNVGIPPYNYYTQYRF
jgi:hypothetical protein